jgi:1-aminocyclopropane-1-carboxylate deaminase
MFQISPINPVETTWSRAAGIRLLVKRDDLIHPQISGNKWRKLSPHLAKAKKQGAKQLVSFGGPYSNHLHALAFAGRLLGLETIGLVRGHVLDTPTMRDAQTWGMTCHLLNYAAYDAAKLGKIPAEIAAAHTDAIWVPEGGFSADSVRAFDGICNESNEKIDHWIVASGSGCTTLGIWLDSANTQGAAHNFLLHEILVYGLNGEKLPTPSERLKSLAITPPDLGVNLITHEQFNCGGFAKTPPPLLDFVADWEAQTEILLDPVYTAKTAFAVKQLCLEGHFAKGETVLIHHTGGLQGRPR